ncbi:MAG TPA: Crp/Fnr family transcriptional regulator [Vicinamibacterales bacterium]|nr:Crp/Fnr family transcriptional regulator [Vicinamibacterales bacterium]
MTSAPSVPARANRLLAALPVEDYRRISPALITRPLKARQILRRRGESIKEIYFPGRSLCSLVLGMADGASAEIAVVGPEGLIGIEAALGPARGMSDVAVQVAGDGMALAMSVEAFRRELEHQGALYAYVTKYAQAMVAFLTQSVACNGLHSTEARACRWLLHAQDRLETNDLAVTHELLSTMLAVRRPTVSLMITDLAQAGIISTHRGTIRIVDRSALERRACECYRIVKAFFDAVLAPPDSAFSISGVPQWRESSQPSDYVRA